jgi:DNA-binding CsgD family transcriptional regulator
VLNAFEKLAHATEAAVLLSASASPSRGAAAGGILHGLLSELRQKTGVRHQADRLLEALSSPGSLGETEQFAAMAGKVLSLLSRLAEEVPVVIVVDDADHADALSIAFVRELALHAGGRRMMLVVGEHDWAPEHYVAARQAMVRADHVHPVRLTVLRPYSTSVMLAESLGAARSRSLARPFYEASGGNPLLLRALIADNRSLAEFPGPDGEWDLVAGPEFRQAVLAIIRSAGAAETANVARGLAVLDDLGRPDALVRLLGCDRAVVASALETLEAAGLLRDGRLRGPQVRAAILTDPSFTGAAELHVAAARVLYESGAPVDVVAAHLLEADSAPGGWAIEALRRAADELIGRQDYSQAGTFLELALRCSADPAEQITIRALLTNLTWYVSPSLASRHFTSLTVAARERRLSPRSVAVHARKLGWLGRLDEAQDMLACLQSGPRLDAASAVEHDVTYIWLALTYPRRFLCREDLVQAAGRLAEADLTVGNSSWIRPLARLTERFITGDADAAVAAAEQIVQGVRLDGSSLEPLQLALMVLDGSERLDLAEPWLAAMTGDAEDGPAPLWQALRSKIEAKLAWQRGDVAEAARSAREALSMMEPESLGVGIGLPLGLLAMALTEMGRHDLAAEQFLRPVPASLAHTPQGVTYLTGRARHFLATNRLRAALGDFQAVGEVMRHWHTEMPGLAPWRLGAAETHLALGENKLARGLIEEQMEVVTPENSRMRGTALRLLAATCPPRQRPEILSESVKVLEHCGDALELAYTLEALAKAHRLAGNAAAARAVRQRAHRIATVCGATTLRQRLSGEEERPGPAPDSHRMPDLSAALSGAESRVAGLAVEGYTNREIAERLSITASTVEQHLTRVYRKLRVAGKQELLRKFPLAGAA